MVNVSTLWTIRNSMVTVLTDYYDMNSEKYVKIWN
jgi:hypothetical protein